MRASPLVLRKEMTLRVRRGSCATRISYMGELGWELYVPTEWTIALFDMLVRGGQTSWHEAVRHACDGLPAHGKGLSSLGP